MLPWLLVLLTGAALYGIVYYATLISGNVIFFASVLMVGAVTVPAAFVMYASWLAGVTSVPVPALGMAAAVGGVVGVAISGVVELAVLPGQHIVVANLGIGLIEESTKLIVPLALFLAVRRFRHREIDGLLIGLAVGTGFAALETAGYGLQALLHSNGSLQAVDEVMRIRAVAGPPGHLAWTGLATLALWRLCVRRTGRCVAGFLATFCLVVVLHGLWDLKGVWWMYASLSVIGLSLLHYHLWRARSTRVEVAG
jgi:RsiW-degrading membrane proteinase PrsW (M82 family)